MEFAGVKVYQWGFWQVPGSAGAKQLGWSFGMMTRGQGASKKSGGV